MIELTTQQIDALETPDASAREVVNPRTRETFILVPLEEYKRLIDEEYDDTPWTKEELSALAWEAGKSAGWDEMDDYDSVAEKP